MPLGIVVNRTGERFYDEGEDLWPKRYAIWGRLVAQQPGQIAYSIIDSKVVGRFMPSVFPPIRANSIGELAAGSRTARGESAGHRRCASIGPCSRGTSITICSTIAAHGRAHAAENALGAEAIDQPPFFGYPLRPGITFTYLGVQGERTRGSMRSR